MARKRTAEAIEEEIKVQRPTKQPRTLRISHADVKEDQIARRASVRRISRATDEPNARAQPMQRQKASRGNTSQPLEEQKSLKRQHESDNDIVTPQRKRQHRDAFPTPQHTPSRDATSLLDRLQQIKKQDSEPRYSTKTGSRLSCKNKTTKDGQKGELW